MITINKEDTRVWWKYLSSYMYPVILEMFTVLATHCEENCEHCHLILCKKLEEEKA